jgi:hypothetical protein
MLCPTLANHHRRHRQLANPEITLTCTYKRSSRFIRQFASEKCIIHHITTRTTQHYTKQSVCFLTHKHARRSVMPPPSPSATMLHTNANVYYPASIFYFQPIPSSGSLYINLHTVRPTYRRRRLRSPKVFPPVSSLLPPLFLIYYPALWQLAIG